MELYKNAVLTVIAISLTWIAASDLVAPARAQMEGGLTRVMICDESGRCAHIDPAYDALQIKTQP